MLLGRRLGGIGLEGQRELDRGIVELGDRGERDAERRRHSAEGQADREDIVFDLQVPEAVLDDDRHLVREALEQDAWEWKRPARGVLKVM